MNLPIAAAILAFTSAAIAAPNPSPADNAPTNTVPVAWHDVEAGAAAVASAAADKPKRWIDETIEGAGALLGRDPKKHKDTTNANPMDEGGDHTNDPSWGKRDAPGRASKASGFHGTPPPQMTGDHTFHGEQPDPTPAGRGPMRRDDDKNDKRQAGACEGPDSQCWGEVTHWDGGLGACGWQVNTESDFQVSLPHALMGEQSNGNPYCGRSVTIFNSATGATAQATVGDKCMGCEGYNIDLTNVLFNTIAGCDGRCGGFQWWFN